MRYHGVYTIVSITIFLLFWTSFACELETIVGGSGPYSAIQDALNNTCEGGTIIVNGGSYDECVLLLNSSITIRGNDSSSEPIPELSCSIGANPIFKIAESFSLKIEITIDYFKLIGNNVNSFEFSNRNETEVSLIVSRSRVSVLSSNSFVDFGKNGSVSMTIDSSIVVGFANRSFQIDSSGWNGKRPLLLSVFNSSFFGVEFAWFMTHAASSVDTSCGLVLNKCSFALGSRVQLQAISNMIGSVVVEDCKFDAPESDQAFFAALDSSDVDFTLSRNSFLGTVINSTTEVESFPNNGRCVYLTRMSGGKATIDGNIFQKCVSSGKGGAISFSQVSGSIVLHNNLFEKSGAIGTSSGYPHGGVIYLKTSLNTLVFELDNNTFRENYALGYSPTTVMSGLSKIGGNGGKVDGGIFYFHTLREVNMSLTNNFFTNNLVVGGDGADGWYNNTIPGNCGGGHGGSSKAFVFYGNSFGSSNSEVILRDNVFFNNTISSGGGGRGGSMNSSCPSCHLPYLAGGAAGQSYFMEFPNFAGKKAFVFERNEFNSNLLTGKDAGQGSDCFNCVEQNAGIGGMVSPGGLVKIDYYFNAYSEVSICNNSFLHNELIYPNGGNGGKAEGNASPGSGGLFHNVNGALLMFDGGQLPTSMIGRFDFNIFSGNLVQMGNGGHGGLFLNCKKIDANGASGGAIYLSNGGLLSFYLAKLSSFSYNFFEQNSILGGFGGDGSDVFFQLSSGSFGGNGGSGGETRTFHGGIISMVEAFTSGWTDDLNIYGNSFVSSFLKSSSGGGGGKSESSAAEYSFASGDGGAGQDVAGGILYLRIESSTAGCGLKISNNVVRNTSIATGSGGSVPDESVSGGQGANGGTVYGGLMYLEFTTMISGSIECEDNEFDNNSILSGDGSSGGDARIWSSKTLLSDAALNGDGGRGGDVYGGILLAQFPWNDGSESPAFYLHNNSFVRNRIVTGRGGDGSNVVDENIGSSKMDAIYWPSGGIGTSGGMIVGGLIAMNVSLPRVELDISNQKFVRNLISTGTGGDGGNCTGNLCFGGGIGGDGGALRGGTIAIEIIQDREEISSPTHVPSEISIHLSNVLSSDNTVYSSKGGNGGNCYGCDYWDFAIGGVDAGNGGSIFGSVLDLLADANDTIFECRNFVLNSNILQVGKGGFGGNCEQLHNKIDQGGGGDGGELKGLLHLLTYAGSNGCPFELTNLTVSKNVAICSAGGGSGSGSGSGSGGSANLCAGGGGVFSTLTGSNSSLYLTDSKFEHNEVVGANGGDSNSNDGGFGSSIIGGNVFVSIEDDYPSLVSISKSIFSYNNLTGGIGGLGAGSGGAVEGGSIYVSSSSSSAIVLNSVLGEGNTVSSGRGGNGNSNGDNGGGDSGSIRGGFAFLDAISSAENVEIRIFNLTSVQNIANGAKGGDSFGFDVIGGKAGTVVGGGGLFVKSPSPESTFSLTKSSFRENLVSGGSNGDGWSPIENSLGGNVLGSGVALAISTGEVSESIFHHNVVNKGIAYGSGLSIVSYLSKLNNVSISSCEFSSNSISASSSSKGAAIYVGNPNLIPNCSVSMRSNRFHLNSIVGDDCAGAGISISDVDYCEMSNNTFTNNSIAGKSSFGGALSIQNNAKSILKNDSFWYNSADGLLSGGGAFVFNAGSSSGQDMSIIAWYLDFRTNSANEGFGGAIYHKAVDMGLDFSLQHSSFWNNTALEGGAIHCLYMKEMMMSTSDFFSNVATTSGGAVRFGSASSVFSENSFVQNSCGDSGGSISLLVQHINEISFSSSGNLFLRNFGGRGGAISAQKTSPVSGGGGGNFPSRLNFSSDCFDENTASASGGSIYVSVSGTQVGLDRCVFNNSRSPLAAISSFDLLDLDDYDDDGCCDVHLNNNSFFCDVSDGSNVEQISFSSLSSSSMLSNVFVCPVGYRYFVSSSSSIYCSFCPAGFGQDGKYLFDQSGFFPQEEFVECLSCPSFAECSGGENIRASYGFYIHKYEQYYESGDSHNREARMQLTARSIKCPEGFCCSNEEECASSQCVPSRTGVLCAECADDYCIALNGESCLECSKCGTPGRISLFVIINAFFIPFVVMSRTIFPSTDSHMKVFEYFFQTLPLVALTRSEMTSRGGSGGRFFADVFQGISVLTNLQFSGSGAVSCPFRNLGVGSLLVLDYVAPMLYFCCFFGLVIIHAGISIRVDFLLWIVKGLFYSPKWLKRVFLRFEDVRSDQDEDGDEGVKLDEDADADADKDEDEDDDIVEITGNNHSPHKKETENNDENSTFSYSFSALFMSFPFAIRPWSWRFSRRYTLAFLTLLLESYRTFLAVTLKYIQCEELEGVDSKRLFWYSSHRCYSWWQIFLWIGLVVFLIPCPLYILLARLVIRIFYFKRANRRSKVPQAILDIFEEAYVPSCKWWESILLGRRLVLILVYFFVSNLFVRSVLLSIFCLIFLAMHLFARPFISRGSNQLEAFSLTGLSLLSLLNIGEGQLESLGQDSNDALVVAIFVIQIVSIIIVLIGVGMLIGLKWVSNMRTYASEMSAFVQKGWEKVDRGRVDGVDEGDSVELESIPGDQYDNEYNDDSEEYEYRSESPGFYSEKSDSDGGDESP